MWNPKYKTRRDDKKEKKRELERIIKRNYPIDVWIKKNTHTDWWGSWNSIKYQYRYKILITNWSFFTPFWRRLRLSLSSNFTWKSNDARHIHQCCKMHVEISDCYYRMKRPNCRKCYEYVLTYLNFWKESRTFSVPCYVAIYLNYYFAISKRMISFNRFKNLQ